MSPLDHGINGPAPALAAARAVEELRRGRAIGLGDDSRVLLVVAIETLEAPLFERLKAHPDAVLDLIITPERAQAAELIHNVDAPSAIRISDTMSLDTVQALAGLGPIADRHPPRDIAAETSLRARVDAALQLAKVGRLLPALLVADVAAVTDPNILQVRIEDLPDAERLERPHVEIVSRANVPLVDAVDCEIVLFRQRGDVSEHLAIVLGKPDTKRDVPVRLHSACLTGDVLGSLRCDCGDQLKRAINRIVALGGGVLLYLDQEGRGIGLANKLRAYALQDSGLDTVDADQHLGFLPDERDYAVAAAALRELGIASVRLLTNNPAKIDALEQHGIAVAGRLPLVASVNAFNQRYLKAKLDRAGHLAE